MYDFQAEGNVESPCTNRTGDRQRDWLRRQENVFMVGYTLPRIVTAATITAESFLRIFTILCAFHQVPFKKQCHDLH